jgi:hypothetical protein
MLCFFPELGISALDEYNFMTSKELTFNIFPVEFLSLKAHIWDVEKNINFNKEQSRKESLPV